MKKIIITTGGTGGHIYPALSIGKELRKKDIDVLFVGSEHRMEKTLVPEENFDFIGLDVIQLKKPISILKMILAIKDTFKVMLKEKPKAIIGFGNYISLPTLISAKILRIPYYLQEQNLKMGAANKYFYKGAKKIFIAFEKTLDFIDEKYKNKFIVSGNPIREDFYNRNRELDRKNLGINADDKVILVIGGSLGAKNINKAIVNKWEKILNDKKIKLYWATGKDNYSEIIEKLELGENTFVQDYFHNTAQLMNASDLVVCRAGASTISELIELEKPSILIPYNHVGQRENAEVLEYVGCAKIYEDDNAENGVEEALNLINKKDYLDFMYENIKSLKSEKATKIIVDELLMEEKC